MEKKAGLIKKVAIITAMVVTSVTVLIVYLNAQKYQATTMRLLKTQGVVKLLEKDKEKTIKDNLRLANGNVLLTEIASLASIALDDAKIITLNDNSKALFEQQGKKLNIKLTEGSLFFEVTQKLAADESFDIRTSSMTVGIRGTSGYVTCDDEGHEALIITDGKVVVTGKNPVTGEERTCTVEAGQRVRVYRYDDKEEDSIMFVVEEVPPEELSKDITDRLLENQELLAKVMEDTGWSEAQILGVEIVEETVATTGEPEAIQDGADGNNDNKGGATDNKDDDKKDDDKKDDDKKDEDAEKLEEKPEEKKTEEGEEDGETEVQTARASSRQTATAPKVETPVLPSAAAGLVTTNAALAAAPAMITLPMAAPVYEAPAAENPPQDRGNNDSGSGGNDQPAQQSQPASQPQSQPASQPQSTSVAEAQPATQPVSQQEEPKPADTNQTTQPTEASNPDGNGDMQMAEGTIPDKDAGMDYAMADGNSADGSGLDTNMTSDPNADPNGLFDGLDEGGDDEWDDEEWRMHEQELWGEDYDDSGDDDGSEDGEEYWNTHNDPNGIDDPDYDGGYVDDQSDTGDDGGVVPPEGGSDSPTTVDTGDGGVVPSEGVSDSPTTGSGTEQSENTTPTPEPQVSGSGNDSSANGDTTTGGDDPTTGNTTTGGDSASGSDTTPDSASTGGTGGSGGGDSQNQNDPNNAQGDDGVEPVDGMIPDGNDPDGNVTNP